MCRNAYAEDKHRVINAQGVCTLKSILILLFAGVIGRADQNLPLFAISKETNANVVHYDAKLNDDCKLDRYKPVKIYWVLNGRETKDLGLLDKPLYNLDYDTKSPDKASGQILAFKNRSIPFELNVESSKTNLGCKASVKAKNPENGLIETIASVRLRDFHGKAPKKVAITFLSVDGKKSEHVYKF
jgi:hypothetical protein